MTSWPAILIYVFMNGWYQKTRLKHWHWHTRDVHSRCIAIAIALGNVQNHDIPRKGQLCRPTPSFTNCVHDCSTGAATTRRSWQVNHPYVQGWWSNRLKCNCRLQLRLSWNEKVPKENFCDSLALGWGDNYKMGPIVASARAGSRISIPGFFGKGFCQSQVCGIFSGRDFSMIFQLYWLTSLLPWQEKQ